MSASKAARLVPQTSAATEEMVHISSFGVIRQGGKVLLVRRPKTDSAPASWGLPAAVINYGEHPESAMKRIVTSMLDAVPIGMKLIEVQSYGDKHWDICFPYNVTISAVGGKLSPDIEKAEYFDLSNLPPDLREGHREVIQTLSDHHLLEAS